MASELLKTFKKIENARQRGINILKSLDYKINDNASLSTIHEYLNFIPNDNSNLILPIDLIMDPDIDPEVWREPSDWPDIRKILSEAEDIGTYTPCVIALLDNTVDETQIVYNVTSSTDLSTFKYYCNTSVSYKLTSKCITSDGATYDLTGSNYTHVWDKTKDINNKYRYIIFYMNTEIAPNRSWFFPARLNAIAMACNQYIYATSADYDSAISNSHSNIGGYKCQAVYLINPKTQLGVNFFNKCINTNSSGLGTVIGSNNKYNVPLKKVIIEKPLFYDPYYRDRFGFSSQGGYYKNLNYVEDYRDSYYTSMSYNSANSLVYYKGSFKGLSANTNDNDSSYSRPRLKYIYLTDADSITEIPEYKFNNYYSVVTDIVTPFKNVTKIHKRAYSHCGLNLNKIMEFPKVTELGNAAFYRISSQIISLPSLKTISTVPFEESRCRILLLDSLESITSLGVIHGLTGIYAPNLKSATGDVLTNRYYSGSLMYNPLTIDFSSLETLTKADYFRYNNGLRNLILKQNFKFNLDLSNCRSLTKNCALDLINKCAQLEESESYTLTFHSTLYYSLTEEERAVATNKGWTVTFK